MAYPENQIRSFIKRYSPADPLDYSFLQMETAIAFCHKIDTHVIPSVVYLLRTLIAFLSSADLKIQYDSLPVPAVAYI